MDSFSVSGPGIVANAGGGDPGFAPQDAPQGSNLFVILPLADLTGAFGTAVAGGTTYGDLFFSGFAVVNANVVVPTGTATLRVPATWSGSLVACTPSSNCVGAGGMNVFNLNFPDQSGVLTISFADDGTGLGFDYVTNASFTPVPEPSSTVLILLGVLASRTKMLDRYRLRQRSGSMRQRSGGCCSRFPMQFGGRTAPESERLEH
jgi:hypothetical protein